MGSLQVIKPTLQNPSSSTYRGLMDALFAQETSRWSEMSYYMEHHDSKRGSSKVSQSYPLPLSILPSLYSPSSHSLVLCCNKTFAVKLKPFFVAMVRLLYLGKIILSSFSCMKGRAVFILTYSVPKTKKRLSKTPPTSWTPAGRLSHFLTVTG